MKIFVIDDDPVVVQSCRRILEAEGITVEVAESVAEAEKILKIHQFDLTLTDIKMPERDGFDMIRQVKSIQPNLPVLVMTGYLTERTIEKGRNAGADDFIGKPFTPDELMTAVFRLGS